MLKVWLAGEQRNKLHNRDQKPNVQPQPRHRTRALEWPRLRRGLQQQLSGGRDLGGAVCTVARHHVREARADHQYPKLGVPGFVG